MMRGAGGALAVTVAALLVCCSADQDTESGNEPTAERYNAAAHKTESLGHPGVGFARQAREAGQYRFVPYLMSRRYDYVSPYSGRRWAPGYGYYGDGQPKRNFDEIDRSDLDTFVRKRNFDEIDQTAMPFPSSKRGLGLNPFAHKRNFDEIDQTLMPLPYSKRATMFRPMGGMDEIDLSEIPFSSKRSLDMLRSQHN